MSQISVGLCTRCTRANAFPSFFTVNTTAILKFSFDAVRARGAKRMKYKWSTYSEVPSKREDRNKLADWHFFENS